MAPPKKSASAKEPGAAGKSRRRAPETMDAVGGGADPTTGPGLGEDDEDDDTPATASPKSSRQVGGAIAERPTGVVGTLNCVKGPEAGGVLALEPEGDYRVGRGRDNDLVVKDIAASRVHLRVVVEGTAVRIIDQDSGNGTRLNGVRVKDATLKDGDRVEVGNSLLQFAVAAKARANNGTPRQDEAWMSSKTQAAARPEVEELRRELLQASQETPGEKPARSSPRSPAVADAGAILTEPRRRLPRASPVSPPPEEMSSVRVGPVSRTTVLVVLLVIMGTLTLALSIAVGVMATHSPGGSPPASRGSAVAALAERAVELERAGDHTRADLLLDEVRRLGSPAEYEAVREKLDLMRVKAAPADPPPRSEPAPEPVKAAPAPEPARAAPAKSAPPPRAAPAKSAPPPKAAPAKSAPPPKAASRKLSNDEAKEMFQKALSLMQDDQFKAAIKLCTEIIDRAEDGPYREKARQALPRWKKKAEDGD